ncbi:MAG: arginine--tRNA ligase, partial [Cyclobacteriaceae bacterium]
MNIESRLQPAISSAFKELFDADLPEAEVSLQPTRKDFEGTHTFVTFPYARLSKKSPEETGRMIGEYLAEKQSDVVAGYNVVKGFLNIELQPGVWTGLFGDMYADSSYGQLPATNERVMVEYSSPNTNKPLHLGHLRNNFLGFSVSQILKQAGYDVLKA